MGFASGSIFMGAVIRYCDEKELWDNLDVLEIVERLAISLMEEDWDTVDDFYDSKTFQNACKQSEHEGMQYHYEQIKEWEREQHQ